LFQSSGYYKIIFLRQNRPPVVRYIPNYEVNISDDLNISFVAIDPDEDNITENITAERIILTGTGGSEPAAARLNFKPSASDIGYYIYNFSAKDVGGLSDWQNGVVVKIKCEYRESATLISSGKWSDGTKTFDYDPTCCDVGDPKTPEYSRLSFKDGCGTAAPAGCAYSSKICKALTGAVEYSQSCECISGTETCTDCGDLGCDTSTGECNAAAGCTPLDNYFCDGNYKVYCSTEGVIDTTRAIHCVNGCLNGACICDCDYGCYASGGCKPEPCVPNPTLGIFC